MNAVGIHALVWVPGWSESECRSALEATKDAGFDLIEIPLLYPSEVDAAMTRRLLDDFELDATCSLGLGFETDISSIDDAIVARGEQLLDDAVAVTRDVGASFLGGVTYSAMGKYLQPPTEQGRSNCVETLRRVAQRAATAGVTVGIEPVNRYESNLVNTAEQALRLLHDVGAGNLTVHLDSYHMNIEERDLGSPVHRCGDRLGYAHIGESHRGYLGSGSVDFPALFRALADTGYAGPIVFESFSSVVVSESFCSALGVWRDPWRDGRDLARHARSFIETQLAAVGASREPRRTP